MSAIPATHAKPRWQQQRRSHLEMIAAQAASDIDALLALDPGSLVHMSECFGRRFEFLDPHRKISSLRGARVSAYSPAFGQEDCPACWVKNGDHTPLTLREAIGRVDITVCPRCTFCELLPNVSDVETG